MANEIRKLKVGDVIRRFETIREIEHEYVINRVTKTQAITDSGKKFIIEYEINVFKKPLPHQIARVEPCKGHGYCGYPFYLIDKTKL